MTVVADKGEKDSATAAGVANNRCEFETDKGIESVATGDNCLGRG